MLNLQNSKHASHFWGAMVFDLESVLPYGLKIAHLQKIVSLCELSLYGKLINTIAVCHFVMYVYTCQFTLIIIVSPLASLFKEWVKGQIQFCDHSFFNNKSESVGVL